MKHKFTTISINSKELELVSGAKILGVMVCQSTYLDDKKKGKDVKKAKNDANFLGTSPKIHFQKLINSTGI